VAAILQTALSTILGNEAGQLLAGKTGYLDQVTPHHTFVGLFQMAVVQAFEGLGDEGVGLVAIRDVQFEGLATVQEGADLIQTENA